jgi:trehalose 6-phosphate phosphatase
MDLLKDEDVRSAFFDRLRSSRSRVLLLDYDGTLAPFQVDRNQALPYPEVPALLRGISEKGTRVVLVSGRPALDLSLVSGIEPRPEIWGSHGCERLHPNGRYELMPLPENVCFGLSLATERARTCGLASQVEQKPGGTAVHWRGLGKTEVAELRAKLLELWEPLLTQHSLQIAEFDGGLEIRPRSGDKGIAVRAILKEAGEGAAVAYLGDDQTDEDAFHALNGKGLTVLVRPQSRPTAAEIWLRPPEELIDFLKEWLRAPGEEA